MKKYFKGIQALRGISFVMVFISHSGTFMDVFGLAGGCAVEIFFVISGFLSGYFFDKESVANKNLLVAGAKNVLKKYKNFMPLYIVFVLVACVSKWSGKKNLLLNLLLLQSYCGDANIALTYNWPTWFLSSIMLSFFLAPLLNVICEKVISNVPKNIIAMVLIFALQFAVAYNYRVYNQAYDLGYYMLYINPATRVMDFFQGILLGKLIRRFNVARIQNHATLLETIIIFGALMVYMFSHKVPTIYQWTTIWVPVACGLVLIFSLCEGSITKALTNKVFIWIGNLSFELYIIHRLILYNVSMLSTSIIAYVFAIILTMTIAIMSREIKNILIKK